MKIVLFALNGSWSHSCLALRCLRGPLERAGFEVALAEYNLKDRTAHILERLYNENADIYSFSCYIWNLNQTLGIARALSSIRPEARIVLGGPEVSFATERFDGMDWIDAIVCGEGEEALPALCEKMRDDREFSRIVEGGQPDVMRGEGILYRDGEATGSILYYESSRGCPYSCAYCLSSATHGVRMKSVAETLADLERFETLAIDHRVIKFVDRTFNADQKRANAIWKALLDEKFTGCYHFEVCASLLDEESFEVLSKFPKGKIQLEFGLQSTNAQTLAASARHIDPTRVIESVRRVYEMGNIHVHLDLIAGLPYEDYARFGRSFDDAYGCSHLLQLGFLKLLHGTPLRDRAEEYGYVAMPEPPYTLLQSRWISYPEMQRLHHIAEAMERYLESGRFVHALSYLTKIWTSPFAFWEGLADFLQTAYDRPLQRLSQPEAFMALLRYATEKLDGVDEPTLKKMLAADFSQHEHKNPPYFLR